MFLDNNSLIYEINTGVYLKKLSHKLKTQAHISDIPDSEFIRLKNLGVSAIWFMGIWERSPVAIDIASNDQAFMASVREVLPDYKPEDLIGSAYSIPSYSVNKIFGGEDSLNKLRLRLNNLGIKLILDFVPNHMSVDNVWLKIHPEFFIKGTANDLKNSPESFIEHDGQIYALGRDPTFPAWSDVIQLNAFNKTYRNESIKTLCALSKICDGVRCDMSMLIINSVFKNTWGDLVDEEPSSEYWEEVIGGVRKYNTNFIFIAESYWEKEKELIRQGFNYCYDKTLYDHICQGDGATINTFLDQTKDIRDHMLTFIENHDELRASSILSDDKALCSTALISTLPGLSLIYDGQLDGNKVRIPVQLDREPYEKTNHDLYRAYNSLLKTIESIKSDNLSNWKLLKTNNLRVIAYQWDSSNKLITIMINYSESTINCELTLNKNSIFYKNSAIDKVDPDTKYQLINTDSKSALSIDLTPWQVCILES